VPYIEVLAAARAPAAVVDLATAAVVLEHDRRAVRRGVAIAPLEE
jgi:hypothetical protein